MKTNEQIELLNGMINQANNRNASIVDEYKKRLRDQWTKIFENDKQLQKDAENALNASKYDIEEDGIYSWYRVKTNLADYESCKDYLENWLSDSYCLQINWKDNCFQNYLGPDCLIIQDDTRRDNGVWQESKLIIDESEYKDDDGVNVELRNALIEKHMEKTGFFPGVFKVDQYNNIFLVDTKEGSK
jgi:hypothetical protein